MYKPVNTASRTAHKYPSHATRLQSYLENVIVRCDNVKILMGVGIMRVVETQRKCFSELLGSRTETAWLKFYPLFFFLTFMSPCIVNIFQYISNKMQLYTVCFIWKLLYMFRMVPPPIIRSAYNCIYSVCY